MRTTGHLYRRSTAIALLAATSLFQGCSGKRASTKSAEPPVVVYSSLDDVYARGLAAIFQNRTGIEVKLVTDTEETKSSGILNRLLAEKARPRADLFLSGDPIRASVLQSEGIAAPIAEDDSPSGRAVHFSARARVIIYNTNLLRAADAPASIRDLARPEWAAKSCLANPLFGTTAFHAAAMFEIWGDAEATKFFESFSRGGGKMLSSNGEVRRRVSAGQFAVGLTDSDDANVALSEGAPVGVIFPERPEDGALLVPCAAVLIRGGPNPEGGKKLANFLASAAAEEWLARSPAAHLPINGKVEYVPPLFRDHVDELQSTSLDYVATAKRLRQLSSGFLADWVSRQSR